MWVFVIMSTANAKKSNGNDRKTTESSALFRLCGTSWTACGYCKGTRSRWSVRQGTNSSCSYAVYARQISPALYEQMLHRGWRRSGKTVYLPKNELSCCPTYPIRLPVHSFRPSKSQRKVMKQVHNLVSQSSVIPTATATATATIRSEILDNYEDCNETQSPRMTRRKLDHPSNRNTNVSVKNDHARARNQVMFDIIKQSDLFKLLCEWTKSAIYEVFSTLNSDRKMTEFFEHNLPIMPYKVKTLSTKGNLQLRMDNNVTLVSTACASVVGQAGGIVDRGDFAQRVVTVLRNFYRKHQIESTPLLSTRSNNYDNKNDQLSFEEHSEINLVVMIESIDCHIESGQILVQFQVNHCPETSTTAGSDTSKRNNDTSPILERVSRKSPLTCDVNTTPTIHKVDRIENWWKSATLPNRHGQCHNSLPQPIRPYTISVTTLPAHESALDPRVHQLYWHYQHEVHGEPDPMACRNDATTTQKPTTVDDRNMAPERDVAYDPALVGNSCSNNDSGVLNSGWGHHAPAGWRDAAIHMLDVEYRKLPSDQKQQLLDTYGSFYEFLVENPFPHIPASTKSEGTTSNLSFGTYHQHYTLSGGTLVAVGVIDVLPNGLSSVYLFYNPSFANDVAPMGKYAVMKEIEWTKQFAKLPYYYLGYYIHSCSKMKYKGDYKPSDLLCPITKQWVDADLAKSIIDTESPDHNYCSLFRNVSQYTNTEDSRHGDNHHKRDVSTSRQHRSRQHSTTGMEHIALYIGNDQSLCLATLSAQGKNLVRPVLQELVDHIGIDFAVQCGIDLCP
jgi:arginyl-tRNA--protein-N-Asp/Glu arginylyltransferase